MIKPVNGHVTIKPLVQKSFIASQRETFEEIGEVLNAGDTDLKVGSKVYFDSWLAARYHTGEGQDFFWLVHIDDIRAIDTVNE